jgi:hypothetical protein
MVAALEAVVYPLLFRVLLLPTLAAVAVVEKSLALVALVAVAVGEHWLLHRFQQPQVTLILVEEEAVRILAQVVEVQELLSFAILIQEQLQLVQV